MDLRKSLEVLYSLARRMSNDLYNSIKRFNELNKSNSWQADDYISTPQQKRSLPAVLFDAL